MEEHKELKKRFKYQVSGRKEPGPSEVQEAGNNDDLCRKQLKENQL